MIKAAFLGRAVLATTASIVADGSATSVEIAAMKGLARRKSRATVVSEPRR